MNESRRRDFLKVAGGVAVVSGLAGCASEAQEDDEEPEDEEPEPDEPEADEPSEEEEEEEEEEEPDDGEGRIRVAHMIPDYPEVDVYVDDTAEPVFDGLGYTDVTDYIALGGGEYQIRVTAADARSLVLFDEQVEVPGGDTTAVALDEAAENGEEGDEEGAEDGNTEISFQLELFEDDNTPPEETLNDSRLRLIHASPDAPNVDVQVNTTPVFEDIGYAESEYFDIQSGSYEFDVYPADDDMEDDDEPGAAEEADEEEDDDNGILRLTADGGSDSSLLQQEEEDDEADEEEEVAPEEDEGEAEEMDPEEEDEDEEAVDPEEDEEEEEVDPEEDEEEEEEEDEPVYTFDATLEENSVYTAFATGYLDAEAAESDNEFEVVIVQDVVDGEVVEEEQEDEEADE